MKYWIFLLIFFSAFVFSQTISSVEKKISPDGKIAEVAIKGSGFGNKAVPIFYDQVGKTYEKGIANNYFDSFDPDRAITLKDTRDASSSPWSSVMGTVYIQSDSQFTRGPDTGKYYYSPNIKSNLHNPRIHPRSGTPQESKKVYISWWFKQQNETRNYLQYELSLEDDDFAPKEGDEFSVDVGPHWSGVTTVYGRVIAYNHDTKILHANYYGAYSSSRLTGKRLILEDGGKGATLAVFVRSYGSNKYLRVWESDGTEGTFRSSWTNVAIYQGDFSLVQRSNVIPRQWNHMEYFAYQARNYIKIMVNGALSGEGYYTSPSDVAGHSPTIGLIGQDSNQPEMHQQFWMDDIYLDGSFKRIVLGNAPKFADVTHQEVQYFSSWNDGEIKFSPYYGSLDRKKPSYIYIYSEDDVPNQEGIEFESPPKMEN